ncbi:MAG: M14 family metallopeptidase [Nitritalea sp.]
MMRYMLTLLLLWVWQGAIAQRVPSPEAHFGAPIGTDYTLVTYTATEAYFQAVAAASDRVTLLDIGPTEEGRRMPLMVVTSPKNQQHIARYKEISQLLGRAEMDEETARALVKEGKPVVWIDGGLHSTETVASHQLIETLYQLSSREDEETLQLLDELIILLVHTNPDGQEIVTDWYMMPEDVTKRNMRTPYMYQKYVGHDNNRDFFMNNMKESTNISLQQYVEWLPQIIYNHHQTSPAGTVVAGPPYRDPFNHVFDPLIMTSLDGVGAAMINRLNVEDKPGYTRLSGSVFSSWWNGGLRTTPYFHNMIGILTETTGGPTPSEIPVVPDRLIPTHATPYPVEPQPWNFRRSIDYSVSMNYAVLDYARRNADALLFNFYKMGRNAIERGQKDHWTKYPKRAAAVEEAYREGRAAAQGGGNTFRRGIDKGYFEAVFQDPDLRDPRAYILPADQTDFPRATAFINALLKSGVLVHRATADFQAGGKQYPKGSFIVKTAQAFRPHVLDMFEPQDHPNDFQYPGGPPVRPYDAAGWTLAFQMGVEFDRFLEGVEGPFEAIPYGELQKPLPTSVAGNASGYLIDGRQNDAFKAVNQLMAKGMRVQRIQEASGALPAGSFFVTGRGQDIAEVSGQMGLRVQTGRAPAAAQPIKKARIGLFDYYGGSMPSGWVRWLLEQYAFDFEVVYPQDIDAGNLNKRFDVLLFIGPGMPAVGQSTGSGAQLNPADMPAEYHKLLGALTVERSVPALQQFLENGGKVLTVGAASSLAMHLGLPVEDALVEVLPDGSKRNLPGDKYYIPGSILRAQLDERHPANWGMGATAQVVVNRSPVFRLTPEAQMQGIQPLAWFGEESPLISGWAWGEGYIRNGVAAFHAPIGKGDLVVYGPEITFRAQAHNTFKMLFNHLYTK